MRTALVTTTINVPTVLRLYRALDPDVRFFVAVDKKSPATEIEALCRELGNAISGWGFDYQCSDPIGWNCIQRRNTAMLEALKWGADLIVSIDDDNIPLGHYFHYFERALMLYTLGARGSVRAGFDGIQASSPTGWFDVGTLLDPPSPHRGFPNVMRSEPSFAPVVGAKVGVAAGICLGDPDIDSVTRIARGPTVHRVSELLRSGIVVDPARKTLGNALCSWTVFNSQNTAFVRELAPAMFMPPGVGRYDDIFASLICQRVMRDHGYVTHFGPPFCWQQRNPHNLLKDLKAEIFGMEHVVEFSEWLDSLDLATDSVLNGVRGIYTLMSNLDWMTSQAREAGLAWCSDCEKII